MVSEQGEQPGLGADSLEKGSSTAFTQAFKGAPLDLIRKLQMWQNPYVSGYSSACWHKAHAKACGHKDLQGACWALPVAYHVKHERI